ncbi:hypothetical protein [Gemmatimonas sp.]|uniref:hypothetical protein n=1 Tax=Gemmatimonas sp. TaxID=1962908 RepID=UPI0037C01A95
MAGPLWPGHCFLPVWIRSPFLTGTTPMLFGLIDRTTSATSLKGALDKSVERSRGIADRVSKATVGNGDGFALESKTGTAQANLNPVNVEDEMMALADEQIRFLATTRLLEKTYASLRSAIKSGGNG